MKTMKDYELSVKVQKAINFLNNHPAVGCTYDFIGDNFIWYLIDVCKNNQYRDIHEKDPKNITVKIYKNHKAYCKKEDQEFFKGKFEQFFDKYKIDDDDIDLDVPYREVYGCDWEYDHTEYIGEYSFFKFNPDKDLIDFYIDKKGIRPEDVLTMLSSESTSYERYQGGYIKANSFEELIIKTAADVKEKYGDFGYNSFIKDEEKNSKDEEPFFFKPLNDGSGCSEMISNPNYIIVDEHTKNLRWWEWFKGTEEYEKYWKKR